MEGAFEHLHQSLTYRLNTMAGAAKTHVSRMPFSWFYHRKIATVWNWLTLNRDTLPEHEIIEESTLSYFRIEMASENIPHDVDATRLVFQAEDYPLAGAETLLTYVYSYLYGKKVRNIAVVNCSGWLYFGLLHTYIHIYAGACRCIQIPPVRNYELHCLN